MRNGADASYLILHRHFTQHLILQHFYPRQWLQLTVWQAGKSEYTQTACIMRKHAKVICDITARSNDRQLFSQFLHKFCNTTTYKSTQTRLQRSFLAMHCNECRITDVCLVMTKVAMCENCTIPAGNCPWLRIKVPLTVFWTETLTLTLTSDLRVQSHESYGHDPNTCKRSKSKVTRLKS